MYDSAAQKYFITGVWLRKLALTVAGVTSNNHFYFFLHFTIWILSWWLMNRHLKPKRSTANPELMANEINKDLYRGWLWQQEWKEGNSMMSPSTSMFYGLCANAAVFECSSVLACSKTLMYLLSTCNGQPWHDPELEEQGTPRKHLILSVWMNRSSGTKIGKPYSYWWLGLAMATLYSFCNRRENWETPGSDGPLCCLRTHSAGKKHLL